VAASRSLLEALLARVQKRASEPRPTAPPVAVSAVPASAVPASPASVASAVVASPDPEYQLETIPPVTQDISDDDIEEYDDELIEIIDDADVIPQAAAAARAIEPAAFGASLDGRNGAGHGPRPVTTASAPAAMARSASRPASVAPPADLRPETISPRAIAAAEVARREGARRQLRVTSFVELLDASLELGG
jgi:hypothetical protein